MKSAGSLILWLVLILMVPALNAQQGAVRMNLGASEISIEESVTLTIVAIGLDGELDTSALEQNFEIVGRSSNLESQTRINGNRTTVVQTRSWVLELVPRAVGVYTVPSVRVGPESSAPLTLTVTPPPKGAERDLYVEVTIDTKTPWVQSQVLLTVRVFQAIEILDGSLGAPEGDALNVEQLGEDKRYEELRDGRRYAVTERRFAVFPQRSGKLVINPIRLNVSVSVDPKRVRGFFTPSKNVRRQTESIELDVQARPGTGGSWWLPAKGVTLEEIWSADPDEAIIDQPLTRTLVLRVVGATANQLPRIERPEVEGLSIYAEEPVNEISHSGEGLISEQRINWAIIPESIGEHVLPSIAIDWFNTSTGQVETLELGPTGLRVSPSAKDAAQTRDVTPAPDTNVGNAVAANNTSTAALSGQSDDPASGNGLETKDSSAGMSDTSPMISNDEEVSSTLDGAVAGENGANGLLVLEQSQIADAADQTVAELTASVKRWRWISAASLIAWLATVFWMLLQRRARQASPTDNPTSKVSRLGAVRGGARQLAMQIAPLAEVELSCRENDSVLLAQAVLRWAARQFPDDPPRSLSVLADRLSHHEVSDDLRALDAKLYRGRSENAVETEPSPAPAPAPESTRYRELAKGLRQAIQSAAAAGEMSANSAENDQISSARARNSHGLPEL